MAGKNKILKPGEMLFRAGENSDGMYILRKGQIQIFLDKGGTEIVLATVGSGGMIGEMSLFDKKPRSASARALDEVEVTQITLDDFTKILQQIPKWFVTLMTTLSTRLRETNERVQDLEAKYKGNSNPIEDLVKTLQILQLLFYKNGVKEVKSWTLEREIAIVDLANILNMEKPRVAGVLDAIIGGGLLTTTKNQYKKDVLVIANRGDIERFIEFVRKYRIKNPNNKSLPQEFVDVLEALAKTAKGQAYDTFAIEMKQLIADGKAVGFKSEAWAQLIPTMHEIDESLIVQKGPKDLNLKVSKKQIDGFLQQAKVLRAITKSVEKGSPKAA